ncbi:MAG: hypothetical protein HYX97_05780, partial [Chloroflexi bacterium]|nr:hypothetical protein [Chloroflexota bacterium]
MNEVVFGAETCIQDKRLVLNREELVALALADQRITHADLQIVRPGEKVRIVNIYDIVEPRVKVEGLGAVYPGVCGRPLHLVGEGLTHRLAGIAVIGCGETPRQDAAGRGFSAISQLRAFEFVEMSGAGAVPFPSHMINICLVLEHSPGLTGETAHAAFQSAILRLSDRLAQLTVGREPPEMETFDTTPIGGLPGVVLIAHLSSIELLRGPYTK